LAEIISESAETPKVKPLSRLTKWGFEYGNEPLTRLGSQFSELLNTI